MSTIEPDAPAPHVFPHDREAIRAWWVHRGGRQPSRPALGEVRGKGPDVGDVLRVGQLLRELGYLDAEGDLTAAGRGVVEPVLWLRRRQGCPSG